MLIDQVKRTVYEPEASPLLGPIYMVSGTRDNPPPELPWPRERYAYFFPKFKQPFTLGKRTRLGGRDNLGGRVVSSQQVG